MQPNKEKGKGKTQSSEIGGEEIEKLSDKQQHYYKYLIRLGYHSRKL